MFRQLLRIAIAVVVAILFLRLFVVQGLVVPQRIASGSMAPALLGPHREQTCPSCGMRSATDLSNQSAAPACPNCHSPLSGSDGQVRAGQRVVIDLVSWLPRPPRRFEIAAFQTLDENHPIQVKRICGLPGETVQIVDGDLWIDGVRFRKTVAEQKLLAIPVHEHDPTVESVGNQSFRWETGGDSAWQQTNTGWQREQFGPAADRLIRDWLYFRLPGEATCIYDDLAFNAGLSRKMQCVTDTMLVCRIRCTGEGKLLIRIELPRNESLLVLEPAKGTIQVIQNSAAPPAVKDRVSLPVSRLLEGAELTVSTFDRDLLVAIDGDEVFRSPLASVEQARESTATYALATENLEVNVSRLQVYRDIYYLPPAPGGFGVEPVSLPEGGYFLLGDNSPLSRDCRDRSMGPYVDANMLIGRVLAFPNW